MPEKQTIKNRKRKNNTILGIIKPKNKSKQPICLQNKPFAQKLQLSLPKNVILRKNTHKKDMKNSFIVLAMCLSLATYAQIISPRETAKQKAEQRTNNRIDQGIDKGLDKIEGLFKKKDKSEKQTKNKKGSQNQQNNQGNNGNEGSNDQNGENNNANNIGNGNNNTQSNNQNNQPTTLKAYSKFDFVAGEKVIAFEDFSQDAVGDFPAKWNTNASGEVVTLSGQEGKWLLLSKDGNFYPEFLGNLPENFTIELDVATSPKAYDFIFYFVDGKSRNLLDFNYENQVRLTIRPQGNTQMYILDNERNAKVSNETTQKNFNFEDKQMVKVSLWRQKNRLRVYLNEEKIWDVPKAFENNVQYRFVIGMSSYYAETQGFFLSNMRVAVGQPDTRSKLLTEGKLVTRGIAFDVGSDKIKPESYGILKEIAQVLSENPNVKVRIIGHTDSDGNATQNLELSKKRAAAVAKALSSDFKIDASRMQTDGKGASEPTEPNTTPQGKANNRRVEFVKM